ncbi:agmatinase [Paracoccus sp. S1E-3]|uniref:agmatinase n=1 Tax=Paracoccus sp. S1E-3 TaxID=2756130 RepID=UPI0015EF5DD8|nr:agmatinase [Paracoccus sp. S1E-3]MBA4491477.1 agmatinase [Paracoccus sp. S1E-3]
MVNPKYEPVDAAKVARFSDIATFLRTQRVEMSDEIDIGLVGVPFDIGLNYRGGPREAPAAVRQASRIIRKAHPTSGVQPYKMCNIADLGDAPVNPLNKDESIETIEKFFADLTALNIRPIAVGGDHTIPTPILRGIARQQPVGILQIDSHADTLDELCGTKVNHATFMRRALEEGLIDPKRVVQLGLRGSRFSPDDIAFGYEAGFTIITFDEYEAMGRAAAIEKIQSVLGTGRTYMTIDIDGLDPAFCPGTPVPEIGGITPRDCQVIIRALQGVDLVGADISEVAPCYDPTGITSITAANLMFELLCVMSDAVVKAK